jgi:hypothetical protein
VLDFVQPRLPGLVWKSHGLPKRSVSGGLPSKYRMSEGRDSLRL